jgi:hypothetical protein
MIYFSSSQSNQHVSLHKGIFFFLYKKFEINCIFLCIFYKKIEIWTINHKPVEDLKRLLHNLLFNFKFLWKSFKIHDDFHAMFG